MAISSKELTIQGKETPHSAQILTPDALEFLLQLHRHFNARRQELLQQRAVRQKELLAGKEPRFLEETRSVREDPSWHAASIPPDLMKRHVEITGPVEKKMMINAFNSGADIFMADFEDALSPTWSNIIEGQANLIDAVSGTLSFTSPEGKSYALKEKIAVLVVRPRGWHLPEKNLTVDGEPLSGSLVDFGLFFFHNAKALLQKNSAPYFYLPKLESHLEARLWNDVFLFAQERMGLPSGTIRATVLIETILAAFEMEEILYELKEHSSGLNAGRWDYIFSIIKKLGPRKNFLFPDRPLITMTVPFMRAYTQLLVQTCHKRRAQALGGMAAHVPSRKNPQVNEVAMHKVLEDKAREVEDGFDGTWVAHPDLVPIAAQVFAQKLGNAPNQIHRLLRSKVSAADLLNFHVEGSITEAGMRQNISVALQYLEAWLRGVGAVAIFNLMEDVATTEIARAQLWQWLRDPSQPLTKDAYLRFAQEEQDKLSPSPQFDQARQLLDSLVLSTQFPEFLTLAAYQYINGG